MKIVTVSDTHGKHNAIAIPQADVLVHPGDFTMAGRPTEVHAFRDWIASLIDMRIVRYVVLTPGNHDWLFERQRDAAMAYFSGIPRCHVLIDSRCQIDGVTFYGYPWTPWFNDWAFNLPRGGAELAARAKAIPTDTDVVVTHGPPKGILDLVPRGELTGCEHLAAELANRVKPKLHIFGHIHGQHGKKTHGGTVHINASVLDDQYQLVHGPIVVDI